MIDLFYGSSENSLAKIRGRNRVRKWFSENSLGEAAGAGFLSKGLCEVLLSSDVTRHIRGQVYILLDMLAAKTVGA